MILNQAGKLDCKKYSLNRVFLKILTPLLTLETKKLCEKNVQKFISVIFYP